MLSALPLSATLMTIIGCPLTCPSSAPAAYRPRQSSAPQVAPHTRAALLTGGTSGRNWASLTSCFIISTMPCTASGGGRRGGGGRHEAGGGTSGDRCGANGGRDAAAVGYDGCSDDGWLRCVPLLHDKGRQASWLPRGAPGQTRRRMRGRGKAHGMWHTPPLPS
jgi:hypothetical protein